MHTSRDFNFKMRSFSDINNKTTERKIYQYDIRKINNKFKRVSSFPLLNDNNFYKIKI